MSPDPSVSKLCPKCSQFFHDINLNSKTGNLSVRSFEFYDMQALLSSASQGCRLCSSLAEAINPDVIEMLLKDRGQSSNHSSEKLSFDYMVSSLGMKVSLKRPGDAQEICTLSHKPLRDIPAMSKSINRPEFSPPKMESNDGSRLIRTWIDECLKGHDECIALQSRRFKDHRRPTRLLSIERRESGFQIKLCNSTDLSHATQYVTLSHAWGSRQHFKLTSNNIKELSEGIDVIDLPRTFRHAVELTNNLSLQHLWIDALCILQDDELDWERECSLMSGIYSGALINVAASASNDDDGGLWRLKTSLSTVSCIIPVSNQSMGWKEELCVFWSKDPHTMPITDAPLNKRAWVLQERLLSPRTVHFTSTKIFWECPQLLASQIDPHCDFEYHKEFPATKGWIMPPSPYLPALLREERCLTKWKDAVKLYTSRDLTYESDKLVAIAGIARYIHSLWLDPSIKYLAGHWTYHLVHSLLWYRIGPANSSTQPQEYRAPSWSWAAVNGGVNFMSRNGVEYQKLALVQRGTITPIMDTFGAVKNGSIRISGPLCVGKLIGRDVSPRALIHLEGLEVDLAMDEFYLDDDEYLACENSCAVTFHLLGLVSEIRPFNPSPTKGLLLRQHTGHQGEYVRIGAFCVGKLDDEIYEVDYGTVNKADLGLLYQAFRKFKPDECMYLESDGDGSYVIDII